MAAGKTNVVNGGKHLILDLYGCEDMSTMEGIYGLLGELAETANMTALTSPYVVRGLPHNPGLSGIIILETSHISVHTFEEENRVAIDVYCCKSFDENATLKRVVEIFKPEKKKISVIAR